VDLPGTLKSGKALDGFARFLPGQAQLVEALEIKPVFRTGAEKMAKAQSRIAGNGAPTV
jgi:hypothetical protein